MAKFEDVRERVFKFALEIIRLTSLMPKNEGNRVIIRQVIRSSSSIGANLQEAAGAHSKTDFIYILNVSKKEARESQYWLRLLYESNSDFVRKKLKHIIDESDQITKILTASVKNAQNSKLRVNN